MKKIIYVCLFVIPIIFTACSNNADKNISKTKQKIEQNTVVGTESDGSFILKDVNDNNIKVTPTKKGFKFSNAQNKLVLVTFFATWCPPCIVEIPHLNNLQEKYKNDIKIIGILLEQNKSNDAIKKFINDNAINYTVTNSKGNQKLSMSVGGVSSIPYMIMYDKKGNYVTNYLGAVPEEMIDSDIESALKK
ncbi:MAG: TlpA family protein disulfide reductase [Epsilonproteobacteria bacterium]|nr:TlpA family protein disulfide reductase [Campylobacterota bacterium]